MKLVTAAIDMENEKRLRLLAYGKCERILGEDYGKKDYISKNNILSVRQQYRGGVSPHIRKVYTFWGPEREVW